MLLDGKSTFAPLRSSIIIAAAVSATSPCCAHRHPLAACCLAFAALPVVPVIRPSVMSTEATRPSSPKRQRTTGPDSAAMADESKSNSSSWVKYDADCEFPIQNIPFGVFKPTADAASRIGTAIGDQVGSWEAGAMWVLRCAALTHHALSVSVSCFQVVDLSALAKAGLFDSAYAGMLSEVRRCRAAS